MDLTAEQHKGRKQEVITLYTGVLRRAWAWKAVRSLTLLLLFETCLLFYHQFMRQEASYSYLKFRECFPRVV